MAQKNMKSKSKSKGETKLAARDLMIAIAVKHGGDWDKMFRTIENRDWFPDVCDIKGIVAKEQSYLYSGKRGAILTIMDEDYPEILRATLAKPPFVLFIKDGRVSTVPFSQQGIAAVKVPCPKEAKLSSFWEFDEDGDPIEDPTVAKGTVKIEIEYADLDEQWTQGWGCLHDGLNGIADSEKAIAKAIDGLKEALADHVRKHPGRYAKIKWADFFVRRRDGDDDNPESSDVQKILEGIGNA